ncbi:MAG: hypothetical protein JW763_01865 [candidate division Zixibacteria bacterium]|nr:hypothetical protein [candidate division Zixibacteria bacterium]
MRANYVICLLVILLSAILNGKSLYSAESATICATATVVTSLGLIESPPDTVAYTVDKIEFPGLTKHCLYLHHPVDAGLIATIDGTPFVLVSLVTPISLSHVSDSCIITIINTEN